MSTLPEKSGSCCTTPSPVITTSDEISKNWNVRYFIVIGILAILWWLVYSHILSASTWLTFSVFRFASGSHLGASVEFFIYDTVKILLLLVALIYVIAQIRASMDVEKVRDYLAGKKRGVGYFLGATFGAVTPFCSCSSVPLFLGFTTARIPIGISMAFLIGDVSENGQ